MKRALACRSTGQALALATALLVPGVRLLAGAAPLKVDFSIEGRPDSIAPGFAQWMPKSGMSERKMFGDVAVTVASVGAGATFRSTWWKGGALDAAKMSVDGVTLAGGGSNDSAALELRFSGLTPGRHTLATFHSFSESGDPAVASAAINVEVVGRGGRARVQPTHRVTHDDDAASAFVEFDAEAGRETVVRFTSEKHVILCGFELDGSDPVRRAQRPSPADGDEHVDADTGSLVLTWRAGASAKEHHVFFGRDHAAVATATSHTLEFQATTAIARHAVSGFSPHQDYFWRVDEIGSDGRMTRGQVWRLRPRRLAFPGAEGYGRFARGGRGGRVIEVTNLNDSGPGSLRAAVEAEGARTVVFTVSGLITLESKLVITNPYITVAGQTAPEKGITLRKFNFGMMGTHDAIVRFVRVRPGDISGTTLDGMGMAATDHSIIDHASISWTIDEAFSSRSARNITLQRTLISEALNEAGHKKYPAGSRHGYAASISGFIGSFHHNLLAHNSGRNWSLAGGLDQANRHTGWLDVRNNVVYNWGNRTTDGGAACVQFVANYYKPGPASRVFHLLKPERNNIAGFGPQDYYVQGNVMDGRVSADDRLGGVVQPDARRAPRDADDVADHDDARPTKFEPQASFIKEEPFFESFVTTHSARAARKIVLSDVGCTLPAIDENDARMIRETRDGTFTYRGSKTNLPGLPDSQADVGGWENYAEARRPPNFDTDRDGMPDWWETLHRLNPRSAVADFSESNADPDGDGFTQLEEYLSWLAQPHVDCAPGASIEIDLARYTRGFTARPVYTIVAATDGAASLGGDGHTLRFTAERGSTGLAKVDFKVVDAEGDAHTQRIGIVLR